MVKIAKGKMQMKVPYDFYISTYRPNGWRLVNSDKEEQTESDREKVSRFQCLEDEFETLNTLEQLKNFAETHGVDTEGITSRKAMRAAIMSALNL